METVLPWLLAVLALLGAVWWVLGPARARRDMARAARRIEAARLAALGQRWSLALHHLLEALPPPREPLGRGDAVILLEVLQVLDELLLELGLDPTPLTTSARHAAARGRAPGPELDPVRRFLDAARHDHRMSGVLLDHALRREVPPSGDLVGLAERWATEGRIDRARHAAQQVLALPVPTSERNRARQVLDRLAPTFLGANPRPVL